MSAHRYEPGRVGLLLIDTMNDVFSEDGKAYPTFKEEFERIGTFENLKRLPAGAREQGFPVFFAPMSYAEEDYTSWKYISGVHHEMFDNRLFVEGSWGAEFHPELSPQDGEIVIAPHKNIDVLANTDLEVQLRRHNAPPAQHGVHRRRRHGGDDVRGVDRPQPHGTRLPRDHVRRCDRGRRGPGRLRRDDCAVSVHLIPDAHRRRIPHRHAHAGDLRVPTGSTR